MTKPTKQQQPELVMTADLAAAERIPLTNDPKVGSFCCPHRGCKTEVEAIDRDYVGDTIAIVGNGQTPPPSTSRRPIFFAANAAHRPQKIDAVSEFRQSRMAAKESD